VPPGGKAKNHTGKAKNHTGKAKNHPGQAKNHSGKQRLLLSFTSLLELC
jgi:hypothetical protein